VDQGGRGWWIEVEAEVKLLGTRLLVPDLSGWRVERAPRLPEQEPIEIAPDWVCEVLSHTTAKVDRLDKLPLYSQAGVQWVWLVDPLARSIEVFETREGRPTLATTLRDDFAGVLQPFEGEIALAKVWPAA
jgi:Uma2 family endonuclease